MFRIELCSNTRQWSRFTDFYIEHRASIIPRYPVSLVLRDVINYMKQGRGAIIVNERDEVVGIGSFVLGLAEDEFQQKDIAVLGNSCFKVEYRNTRMFIRGLQVLAEQIRDANPDVKEVRIPTSAENAYTNRLYQKFAVKLHSYESGYGKITIYSTSVHDYEQFCDRFR
ncbi:hypothetical protein [Paenibacillus radicis (ex Xue et al. 2023)]|uniref:GNAT family N-acetyltransferase n=1 Tax=Paenibacillus radicis (ex Xue et al. 2023) TaxID=2972489 RepID=A0ABT1YSP9_9BACL|nr:hypothetical protein [Paenibacillus radicis (ex Xue et al. 2023)]MCR8636217.1 hypothetical protein [Paenibacillus radicis (ex Xue et al. 2023)]